ncbi:MAG: hypothetical protein R3E33_04510, partial [Rhodocyclaceae bacterium]
ALAGRAELRSIDASYAKSGKLFGPSRVAGFLIPSRFPRMPPDLAAFSRIILGARVNVAHL